MFLDQHGYNWQPWNTAKHFGLSGMSCIEQNDVSASKMPTQYYFGNAEGAQGMGMWKPLDFSLMGNSFLLAG